MRIFFQNQLTSTPQFRHSPSRVTIQMFYYADPNFGDLSNFKLEPLEKLVGNLYPNKFVDFRLIRLHYPYMNAEILAKYLSANAASKSWGQIARPFFKGLPIVKAPLPHNMPFGVQWGSLLPQIANDKLTTAIQGVKYQVSGRLGRRAGSGRSTVTRKSIGTFQFTSHKSLVDVGRHTFSNKNGSITVKVWIASALFGVNALKHMNKKAVEAAANQAAKL
ncbi:hypothetical protein BX666DRAFT_2020118 [Dichotomocladium elegans]|nr:hypothetical protein BX666DRAFT_2020118 [Dichotomocladium elegans]